MEPAFLPRPQRALPAIATGNRHPEISLPAAFTAFGTVLEKFGANWASTVQLSATREMTTDDAIAARSGDDPVATGHTRVSIRHLYHAGLWAAIRAGWRAGYTAEADHFIVSGSTDAEIARSVEMVKEAIRHAAGYTKFTTDTSRLFELESDLRHPQAWSASAVEERFHQIFSAEEARWVMAEFSQQFHIDSTTYAFSQEEILRLAVKFGRSIKLNEELFDSIRAAKAALGTGTDFDFEPSLDEAETLTTTKRTSLLHALAEGARTSGPVGASQSWLQKTPGVPGEDGNHGGAWEGFGRVFPSQNVAGTCAQRGEEF